MHLLVYILPGCGSEGSDEGVPSLDADVRPMGETSGVTRQPTLRILQTAQFVGIRDLANVIWKY